MQEQFCWGIRYCANTCGACIHTRANPGNIFEYLFSEYFSKFWGSSFRCEYMPCLYPHPCEYRKKSESVSTGVWCVPGFGAGFEIALKPSELQKEGENPGKGHFHFLRQTLVCTKPWFKRDLKKFLTSCIYALVACQGYVQAIVATPFHKRLPLSEGPLRA